MAKIMDYMNGKNNREDGFTTRILKETGLGQGIEVKVRRQEILVVKM